MKKIFVTLLVLFLFVSAYFVIIGYSSSPESAVQDRAVETPVAVKNSQPEKVLPVQAALIPEDLAQCSLFFREIEMLQQQFFWSLGDESFYAFIEDGYTLDEVTQVIEQLDTAGSAMKFRLQYMARFAPSVKYLSPERGISDTNGSLRQFPPQWFSQAVSKGDPIVVPDGEELLPEDIAWMLRNTDISDDDVLQAAALLPDISARMYVDNFVWFDLLSPLEMAWEDRTSLDAIKRTYGIDESELKLIMKNHLSMSAYKLWRKRMKNSHLRHESLRPKGITRAYCSTQYKLKN